jgi:hypothetical protein
VLALYRAVAEREVELAEARGTLAPEPAHEMRLALARAIRTGTITT